MKKIKHNVIKACFERKTIKIVNANRINDAEMEIDLIHNNGFIIFAIKDNEWQQYSFKKKDINNCFLQNLLGLNLDTYIAINSFKSPRRLISNLFGINALWSDLDYYNTKYKGKTYFEMINILSKNKLIKKIPASFYIYSGNGMYPIWLIENANAKVCLPIWKKLMETVHKELIPYGADPKSIEAAHVLRLSGSNNTKTGNKSIIVNNDFNRIFKRYKIKELSDAILTIFKYTKQEWQEIKTKKKKTKKEKEACKTKSLLNIHSLNFARMQDIQSLIEIRNGNCDKKRELLIFLYRYWGNCFHKDPARALEESLELNQLFTQPLTDSEVVNATKRAEIAAETWDTKLKEYWSLEKKPSVYNFFKNTGCYIYSNKKLIELLNITYDEMIAATLDGNFILSTIINTKAKNHRAKDYRAKRQRNARKNENGLNSREQAKMDKIYAIISMMEQGMKTKEISEKLGCNVRLVQIYIKEIKEENITKSTEDTKEVEENSIELNRITDNELALIVI